MRGSYPRYEKVTCITLKLMKQLCYVLEKYHACGLITRQEYHAVILRYGLDGEGCRTCEEIAFFFAVSTSRPYLILARAMLKLRCQADFFEGMNKYLRMYRIPRYMWHAGWLKDRGRALTTPSPAQIKKWKR